MERTHANKSKRSSNRPATGGKPSRTENRPGAKSLGPNRGKAREDKASKRGGAQRSRRTNAQTSAPRPAKPQGCTLCPVFGRCGGCSQLDVPYADQLDAKQRAVGELFADIAPDEALLPILGMDDPFHYRNKVVSPYAPAKGRARKQGANGKGGKGGGKGGLSRADILTGMYEAGTHRLIPTEACALENETAKRVTLAIRDIMARWSMEPYGEDTGRGFVRHAVVRVGHASGEVLVTLVTNGETFPSSKAFCRELVRRVPEITTIVQNVNTRATNVILGEREHVLYGPGFILDELCGLSFRISSQSFYQVNAIQTEVLYEEAIRLAHLTGTETVIDAYCGTGTIGLVAAKCGAARVIGVDSVASAIRDAAGNARHNGIENAEFYCEDATSFMQNRAKAGRECGRRVFGKDIAQRGCEESCSDSEPCVRAAKNEGAGEAAKAPSESPLVLLMDPPRAGSTPEFLAAAAALAPERIVYISCNPQTQARDVRQLIGAGYHVQAIRPVDMFPHTDHVENIVMLTRGEGSLQHQ